MWEDIGKDVTCEVEITDRKVIISTEQMDFKKGKGWADEFFAVKTIFEEYLKNDRRKMMWTQYGRDQL